MSLIKLYITFIEAKGPLLKVFGQLDENAGEFLEKLLVQHTTEFDSKKIGVPQSIRELYPGVKCCAKYKDNKYYRAIVQRVINHEQVQVIFIDYGNTEIVCPADIRLLDNINEPTFSKLHRLATEYILYGVKPITNAWDEPTVNFIEEAIRYKSLKCAVVGEVAKKKLLKIYWGENDLSNYLITFGIAAKLEQEVQENLIKTDAGVIPSHFNVLPPHFKPETNSVMPIQYSVMQSSPHLSGVSMARPQSFPRQLHSIGVPQMSGYASLVRPQGISVPFKPPFKPDVSIPPPNFCPRPFATPVSDEPAQFATDALAENSEHVVYVSHIEDGPLSFAVQLKTVAKNALTELVAKLNEQEPMPISAPLLPGSICLGRYSGDRSLCRAVVMHVANDKYKLYYPDYGNSELLPYNQIYKIPAQFIGVKVMALRFTLADYKKSKVSEEEKDAFSKLVYRKELVMKVTPVEENPTKQYCNLYFNGRNVKDLLREELSKLPSLEYQKSHLPSRGAVERVIVCYVESPTRIVVQLESNKDTLNTVMSCIAAHCRDSKHPLKYEQLKLNMPVCAFYPLDSTWYRAQIKDFNESEASVLFIDYGNEDVVPLSSLLRISQDLVTKIRSLALECCLAGFEMSNPDQELADKLFELINEKTLTMKVLEVMKNQVLIVNLLDQNNASIANYLKTVPARPVPNMQPTFDDEWIDDNQHQKSYEPPSGEDRNSRNDFHSGSRSSNDDSRKNWRNKEETSPRENKFGTFSRDDRKSGRFYKDDGENRFNRQSSEDDRSPRKWDKPGDEGRPNDRYNRDFGRGDGDSGFRKRDFNRADGDSGFRKRDFNRDDGDSGFKKRDFNRDDNDSGFKKCDFNRDDNDTGFRKRDFNREDNDSGFKKRDFNRADGDSGFRKRDYNREDGESGFKKRDFNRDDSDSGFRRRNFNRDDGDSGFKKRDFNRDDGDSGFKKRDFNRDSGDSGGYNRRNDNDSGGWSSGDKTRYNKDSENSWDSKPKGRGDFGDSKFDKKQSYNKSFSSYKAPAKKPVVPYPEIKLGDKEVIEIVYSISPEEFYIQTFHRKDELSQLTTKIAETYASGGTELESAEKGAFCMAKFSEDEVWYRALIESVNGTSATVKFIDYGNGEEVELDKLKVMTSDFCSLPAQAVKCGLLGVHPKQDSTWSDEEQTEFALATESKTLEAELKCKTFSSDTFQIVLRDITDGGENAPVVNLLFNGTEDAIQSIVPPAEPLQFTPYPINEGDSFDIQVTWFISPNQFYIQPLQTNAEFKEMMEYVQDHGRSLKHMVAFDIKAGLSVFARYKDDRVLYRAEVKDTNAFKGSLVLFVDYGNSEYVDYNQVFKMEPEYIMMPCQAILCSLAGVKPVGEEWPKIGLSNIESFFNADSYKCTVLNKAENGEYIISLTNEEGASVSDMLIEGGLAESDGKTYQIAVQDVYTEICLPLLKNQIISARVTVVDSFSKFYVQLVPDEVLKLQEELDAITSNQENLKRLEADNISDSSLCISTLDGTKWMRASIIDKTATTGPLLLFIDNGMTAEVTTDKIFELPSNLSEKPPQAFECGLAIDNITDDDSIEQFTTDVLNKDVLLHIDGIDSQRLLVTAYSDEGVILKPCENKCDKPSNIDAISPMPVLKKSDRTFISHAEAGNISIQRAAESEKLTQLITDLYDHYEEIDAAETEWQAGTLCCAKSAVDEQWYRAAIVNVDSEINVKYLDYGNSETLTADRLRKLEKPFFKPAALSLKVKLPVDWQVSEEHLLELVAEKEFNTKIVYWQDSWYVDLVDDKSEILSDKLVELGFATAIENSPFIKKVSSISKIAAGSKISVCRSHICSPSQFWVILNEDFEDMERLQDRLQNSIDSLAETKVVPKNCMIAAKFLDGMWYRTIYNASENTIFSVDYGNTEPSCNEFRLLPEDFLQPDGYAIPCSLCLEPSKESWEDEAVEMFDSLIPDDPINALILKIDDVVTVDILVNNSSISKALIDKGYAVRSIMTSYAYISHVNSPSDFYVQEENPLLDQIRESLTQADSYTVIEDSTVKEVTNIFAAQYQVDGLWYRAKFIPGEDDSTNKVVLFVDYGNSDEVTSFRELPNELLEMPFMSKHCFIKLPEGIDNWSSEACDKFVELVADGSTLFEIKYLDAADPATVELFLDGQSVSDLLTVKPHITEDLLSELNEKVVVCYINNPLDFWIQAMDAPLNNLLNYFSDVDSWAVAEDVAEGMLVAALFEEDAQWYRAKVLNKTNDGLNVIFVDYGNISIVKEMRQLPEELLKLPVIAKHCSLDCQNPNASEWPDEVIECFKETTSYGSEPVDIKYVSVGETSVVKLFNGSVDIGGKLLELLNNSETVETVPKDETLPIVVVSHINSLEDFYIQLDELKVADMVNNLFEGDNFEDVSELAVGELVAAKFVDEQWYRATVNSVEENSYKVFFVDYGNSSVVTEIKALPEKLAEVASLAHLSSFQNHDWPSTAFDKFSELNGEGETKFELKIINDSIPMVVDLILEGNSVSKMFLEEESLDAQVPDVEIENVTLNEEYTSAEEEVDGTVKDESSTVLSDTETAHINSLERSKDETIESCDNVIEKSETLIEPIQEREQSKPDDLESIESKNISDDCKTEVTEESETDVGEEINLEISGTAEINEETSPKIEPKGISEADQVNASEKLETEVDNSPIFTDDLESSGTSGIDTKIHNDVDSSTDGSTVINVANKSVALKNSENKNEVDIEAETIRSEEMASSEPLQVTATAAKESEKEHSEGENLEVEDKPSTTTCGAKENELTKSGSEIIVLDGASDISLDNKNVDRETVSECEQETFKNSSDKLVPGPISSGTSLDTESKH